MEKDGNKLEHAELTGYAKKDYIKPIGIGYGLGTSRIGSGIRMQVIVHLMQNLDIESKLFLYVGGIHAHR